MANVVMKYKMSFLSEDALAYLYKIFGEANAEKGLGICQTCGKTIKLLKSGKHLYSHYYPSGMKCSGSRKLDYKHRDLAKISERFKEI